MWEALLLKAAIAAATTAATYLTHKIGNFFKAKTDNVNLRNAIDVVGVLVVDSVKAVEQTTKKSLKKRNSNSSLDLQQGMDLMHEVVCNVTDYIPKKIEKQLLKAVPDINAYVRQKAEAAIHDMKRLDSGKKLL